MSADSVLDTGDAGGDTDGALVDGHGANRYATRRSVVDLHRAAVADGWAHTHDRSPYDNLAALLATVDGRDDLDPDRDTVEAFAFAYICGYGPHSTPQALDALATDPDVDAAVPGGERQ